MIHFSSEAPSALNTESRVFLGNMSLTLTSGIPMELFPSLFLSPGFWYFFLLLSLPTGFNGY